MPRSGYLRSMGGDAGPFFGDISRISASSGGTRGSRRRRRGRRVPTTAYPARFVGPLPRRARRTAKPRMQLDAEWNVKGGRLSTSIQNNCPSYVKLAAMQYPVCTDKYENGSTIDFDSPYQHIGIQEFCTKAQLLIAMKSAYRAAFGNQGYDGTTKFGNGALAGNYFDAGNAAWDFSPELAGVGNFRTQSMKFLLEGVYVKRSFQNSCSNALNFKVEVFKARYPLFVGGVAGTSGNENNNPNLYNNYQPASLASIIAKLNDGHNFIGDEVQPNVVGVFNDRSPEQYGESLTGFSAITQYYKRCGKSIQFVLKPGEQRDITMFTRGKHLMNMAKLRMFEEYPSTYHVAVTCRANIVGDKDSSVVSYGSGQYFVTHRAFYKMRYAGMGKTPAHNNMTGEFVSLDAAKQEQINPETDAEQVYGET